MLINAFSCPKCLYTTTRLYNLKRHTASLHAENVHSSAENVHSAAENVHSAAENVHSVAENVHSVKPITEPVVKKEKKVHKCTKCDKSYTRLSAMNAHLEHCNGPANPLQCSKCMKIFSSRSSISNHRKRCTCTNEQEDVVEGATTYNNCTINHSTTNNNTINNNTTNNINIQINHFNYENTDYITEEFARKCFESGVHGVNPMIDKIYFDAEHPENHNVKLKSLNHSLVEVQTENGWCPQSLYSTIERMISNSTGTIIFKIQNKALSAEADLGNIHSLTNMSSEHKRRIRECTKSKLVARRQVEELTNTS